MFILGDLSIYLGCTALVPDRTALTEIYFNIMWMIFTQNFSRQQSSLDNLFVFCQLFHRPSQIRLFKTT